MNAFEKRVYNFIKEQGQPKGKLCVALSGGADSTALLLMLKRLDLCAGAVHINHKIRGAEAERDERFCRELCKRHGIPLKVIAADVPALARKEHLSIEYAARIARYEAFSSLECDIATAHTASDNAETVLYNLSRGTGIAGLYIPYKRAIGAHFVYRPLLCMEGFETAAYVKAQGEKFVTDSTNKTCRYTRNKIRRKLMPKVKKVLGNNFAQSVLTLSLSAQNDERALCALASDSGISNGNVLDVNALLSSPQGVATRAIRQALEFAGVEEISSHAILGISALAKSSRPSAAVQLHGGFEASRSYDKIIIAKREQNIDKSFEIVLTEGYNITPYGRIILSTQEIYNDLTNFPIDCGKITAHLVARSRREGDKIELSGGTKSVKRLMIDKKIPLRLRGRLPVICDGEKIVAVVGCGVSRLYRAGKDTAKTVYIKYEG